MRITHAVTHNVGLTMGSAAAQAKRRQRKAQPESLEWSLEIEWQSGEVGFLCGVAPHALDLVERSEWPVTRYRVVSCCGTVIERLNPDAGWIGLGVAA